MNQNETIYGVASAMGKAGVAVIRISGNRALLALGELGVAEPAPRTAVLAKLQHGEQVIDSALVLYFSGPNSFTGEDVVELHTHGSMAVIRKLLAVLAGVSGVRMAEPGEFSRRAFENGKMDLTAAEGLADLIDAETEAQHKQAVRQMDGELGEIYDEWRDELVGALARVEAYIDFPDEDLPQELVDDINGRLDKLICAISAHMDDGKRGEKIREGLYVAILGAPNVGKSSLLNYLAGREAAIVSDIAGTTRDVVEVNLEIAGLPVTFADTAGLRESADEIENEGIKRALQRAENADLKILMFAAGEEKDQKTTELDDENSIIVVNKDDDAKANGLAISLKNKTGLDALMEVLADKISERFALTEQPLITRARHREALLKALTALQDFSFEKPIELAGEDLRYAAKAIGSITGKIDVEDLLDEIFSSFCIGK